MGLCAPSLRHPHLLRGTVCDQPGMSGMTHKPQQDLSEQRTKSQRGKVRPRVLTGWKPPRASFPSEQKPWPVLWVQRVSIHHLQEWVTGR